MVGYNIASHIKPAAARSRLSKRLTTMELKIPDISHKASTTTARSTANASNTNATSDTNPETDQEVQDREDLANELAAMLDAADEAEAAEREELDQNLDSESDIDLDYIDHADLEGDPEEEPDDPPPPSPPSPPSPPPDSSLVIPLNSPRPPPNPSRTLHSNAPPQPQSVSSTRLSTRPQYNYLDRPIRVPVSPAQKLIAQHFLSHSRSHLRVGTAREIPEPPSAAPSQSLRERWRNERRQSAAGRRTLAPADDPGMHLNELWRNMELPETVNGRKRVYGRSRAGKGVGGSMDVGAEE